MCSLLLCCSCYAQEQKAAAGPARQQAEIRTIYEYKGELGLTDKQEGDLKRILGDFQAYFLKQNKALASLQAQLGEMINKKEDIRKIRKQLEKIVAIQVDASCFDIETSRKLEGILTPIQIEKWAAIQADFRSRAQKDSK